MLTNYGLRGDGEYCSKVGIGEGKVARLGPPKVPANPVMPARSSGPVAASGLANSVATGSRFSKSSRPPAVVVILAVVNAMATVLLIALAGIQKADLFHVVGAALGMFISVALLGLFRQRLALSRSDGRFLDWRMSSSRVMASVTTFAWIAGAANLFVICYELSRTFTS